jgi:hypothetical protein
MATIHAVIFFLVGVAMEVAPAAAPDFFPPGRLDGTNTSALWLQAMGWLNALIGLGYLARLELVPLLRFCATRLTRADDEFDALEALRPLRSFEFLLQVRAWPEWTALGQDWAWGPTWSGRVQLELAEVRI